MIKSSPATVKNFSRQLTDVYLFFQKFAAWRFLQNPLNSVLTFKTKKKRNIPLLFFKIKEQGFILPLFLLCHPSCVTQRRGRR